MAGPTMIKAGVYAKDPQGRTVYVKEVQGSFAVCRLAGSYGATVLYPVTCLEEILDGLA